MDVKSYRFFVRVRGVDEESRKTRDTFRGGGLVLLIHGRWGQSKYLNEGLW